MEPLSQVLQKAGRIRGAATVQSALVVEDVPGAGGVLHMMGNQDERRGGGIVERISWN